MSELRRAELADVPALQDLIDRSGRELSLPYYTPAQAEAITRHVFGVDTQLIEDHTYFVIEHEGIIVACGGWSKRRTLFGGDQAKAGPDPLLDTPLQIRRAFGGSSLIQPKPDKVWGVGSCRRAPWKRTPADSKRSSSSPLCQESLCILRQASPSATNSNLLFREAFTSRSRACGSCSKPVPPEPLKAHDSCCGEQASDKKV
jgi:hypothetical protein